MRNGGIQSPPVSSATSTGHPSYDRISVELFDADQSRRLPWRDRPQAALLLAAIVEPGRDFDAIVVGDYERAFYGDQLLSLSPLFEAYGVRSAAVAARGAPPRPSC